MHRTTGRLCGRALCSPVAAATVRPQYFFCAAHRPNLALRGTTLSCTLPSAMSAPGGASSSFFNSIASWWGTSAPQPEQVLPSVPTTPPAPEESNAAKRARLLKFKCVFIAFYVIAEYFPAHMLIGRCNKSDSSADRNPHVWRLGSNKSSPHWRLRR